MPFSQLSSGLTQSWPTILSQESCDIVSDSLRASENENFVISIFHYLFEVFGHSVALFEVGYHLYDLCDSVVSGELQRTDVDLYVIIEKV